METPERQLEILRRGCDEIIPEPELLEKLRRSNRDGRPLVVKEGFDPTAPDLHLGHTITLRKLKAFQDLGHNVVFLIGDGTGMIGDPSGRDVARRRLTREEVLENAETYKRQVFKILDPDRTRVAFNSEWLLPMTFADLLQLASTYTVARLLERDDFARRYREGRPISVLEFLYPLAQGYDSVALEADVEIGGTDQKFNLLAAREIQREYGQEPQVVITLPLLEGTDGVKKMSKSEGNTIGINESPEEIFGKTMSIPDGLIYRYFELATEVGPEEVEEIEEELGRPGANPSVLKRRLGRTLVDLYHGSGAARAAEAAFDRIHVEGGVPEDLEVRRFPLGESGGVWIVRLIAEAGLAGSRSEARRLIRQGGVTLDGRPVRDENHQVGADGRRDLVLRVGKRKFLRVILEPAG
jgi:tyrosyl-tRNA synthetase